jgi:NAD(P)H-hydrate epimerase
MQSAGCPPMAPLPARDPQGHKGTFGTVVVVGGCAMGLGTTPRAGDAGARVMFGGPVLCARAALRAGCGLVDLALPAPLVAGALAALESATAHALPVDAAGELDASGCASVLDPVLARATAIAIGPGLGGGHAVVQVVVRLLARESLPAVVDADALNALAATPRFDLDFRAPAILTPHPGEFGRLAASLGLPALADGASPEELHAAAQALARRVGAVVVLKGARTTVSDGLHAWSVRAGTPALATGGSGDALAGICASLLAQFGPASRARSLSMLDCARWAVVLHGMAAQRWSAAHGQAGMLAHELCDSVPEAIEEARERGWRG